jgi:hypothetical protein
VFKNKVVRRICGSTKAEVMGKERKLNDERYTLYLLPNVLSGRWNQNEMGDIVCMGKVRLAYSFSALKLKGKIPSGSPGRRKMAMNLREN